MQNKQNVNPKAFIPFTAVHWPSGIIELTYKWFLARDCTLARSSDSLIYNVLFISSRNNLPQANRLALFMVSSPPIPCFRCYKHKVCLISHKNNSFLLKGWDRRSFSKVCICVNYTFRCVWMGGMSWVKVKVLFVSCSFNILWGWETNFKFLCGAITTSKVIISAYVFLLPFFYNGDGYAGSREKRNRNSIVPRISTL